MQTRAEHLEWCKQRAREYLDSGDTMNAIVSMMSDLRKHPETDKCSNAVAALGLWSAAKQDVNAARRFIEGFH
jgi:hypothetical protein